jgi:predicted permease
MSLFLQDFRYALRTLRRSWGLTLVIVVSLAIGIGANTGIFSVVNALLVKPFPYPDADRLVVLWLRSPGLNIPQDWPSPGQFFDVRTENRSFEEMSISQGRTGTLLGLDRPERVQALLTSSSLFSLLGAKPLLGRAILPEEDQPGKPAVVVLSHGFWRRAFNSDASIVGKNIMLNGVTLGIGDNKNQFEVVGVLREDFLLNDEVMPTVASIRQMDMFLPLPMPPDWVNRRGDENYNLMARLKPGVTVEQARADVLAIAGRIRDKDKRDRTFTIDVISLRDQVVGDVRQAVIVLLGSVALVLLIACANVANLLLTRATARQKEVALRTALGAGWQRIMRQLLTESVILALLGGAAGLAVAEAGLYVLRTVNPGNIPRLDSIRMDATVLAFTFGVSILTGVVFGLAPAWRAARVDLNTILKAGSRTAQGDGGFNTSRRRMRSLLVVSEVALSIVLMIGATLLVRSFTRVQEVSPGFNPDHVISMRLGASGRQFPNRDVSIEYGRQLGASIGNVPGVVMRGAVTALPFTSAVGWGGINVEGFTPAPGQELQVDQRLATVDYFRTMQIPLIQGRFFSDTDMMANAPPVAIIDETFAQRFWPNGDALGRTLWNNPKQKAVIVGVVGSVKQSGLDIDGRIVTYWPWAGNGGYQVARTVSDPTVTAREIVRAIQSFDPTLPVYEVQTMDERMYASMARRRFAAIMLGAFAVFALVLAVVGVYGVMSYLVTQGTHDLGVRMALGADRSSIVRLVVRHGFELTIAGVVVGLLAAAALTRFMASLLFGVSTTDVVTFSTVPLALAAIGLIASFLPAYRATRVDPVVALREE